MKNEEREVWVSAAAPPTSTFGTWRLGQTWETVSDAQVRASLVTCCPGLEPYNLAFSCNFNFITIKAMTSFVTLKEKHERLKMWITSRASVLSWAQLLRLHIMSIVSRGPRIIWCAFLCQSKSKQSFSGSLRKGNVSVLTNMHNSAGHQEKPPQIHSLQKRKKKKSNVELLLHTQATLCLPLQEQKVTDAPSTCMYRILNNSPRNWRASRGQETLQNLTYLRSFCFLFFSWAAAAIVLTLTGLKFSDRPPPSLTCRSVKPSRFWLITGERAESFTVAHMARCDAAFWWAALHHGAK